MVFTEHGVSMLSSVLNSKRAIQVNIQIVRIFTRIRQILADNTDLRLEIEKIKTKLDNFIYCNFQFSLFARQPAQG
jgi:regulator of replication initiation timing